MQEKLLDINANVLSNCAHGGGTERVQFAVSLANKLYITTADPVAATKDFTIALFNQCTASVLIDVPVCWYHQAPCDRCLFFVITFPDITQGGWARPPV